MSFSPFTAADFQSMKSATTTSAPSVISRKIEDLRRDLGSFPEYHLDFFGKRIRRRAMRGRQGLAFGQPHWEVDEHWYLYNVGGDQDQVQLNIGMWPTYIRVGLGFQIGRQVSPKIPAFQLMQTFLGLRPPLPFRNAFYQVVKKNAFQIEGLQPGTPDEVLQHLETYVVPADSGPIFVFVGALWDPTAACSKVASDYRSVFLELLPFYEELILAGGRYIFHAP